MLMITILVTRLVDDYWLVLSLLVYTEAYVLTCKI